MSEDVDEDWVPPGVISPGESLKTSILTPMLAKFLQGSVTKDGCRLKMVPGRKKGVRSSLSPPNTVQKPRGSLPMQENVAGNARINGKRTRTAPGACFFYSHHSP